MSWEKNEKILAKQSSQYRTDQPRQTYWGQPYQENWDPPPKKKDKRPSTSPRPRAQKDGKGAKGKGKGKSEGKGKANQGAASGKGDTGEPPWQSGKAQPVPSDGALPSNPAPPPTATEAQFKQMMAMLKKNEGDLPAEVQSFLHNADLQTSRANIKSLHAATSRLGAAKKQVQVARAARISLHTAWKEYLQTACTRWKRFLQEFSQDDAKLEQELQQAMDSLQAARVNLDQVKETVQSEDLGGSAADEEMAELQEKPWSSSAIRDGLCELASNIENLRRQAEESVEVLQGAPKKAKVGIAANAEGDRAEAAVAPAPEPLAGASPGVPAVTPSASMIPFGGAGP